MNYVIVNFDTTPPKIQIIAPNYTTRDMVTEISITANEKLDNWQDIYVIDAEGVRHNLIFTLSGSNKFIGKVIFSDLPLGIATIYAKVRDDVYNESDIAIKLIEIKDSSKNVVIRSKVLNRKISSIIYKKKINTNIKIQKINSRVDKKE